MEPGVPATAGSSCIARLASLNGPTTCPPQCPQGRDLRIQELCTEWGQLQGPRLAPETASLTLAFLFI